MSSFFRTAGLFFSCLCFAVFPNAVSAQDLEILWMTATPTEGQSGDTVHLQARLRNNGPGMAFAVQVQWFLSADAVITTGDTALTGIETLADYLYAGGELTISRNVEIPAFQDPVPPSCLGIIIDPLALLFGDNPDNNIGSTVFTVTGLPLPGFLIPLAIISLTSRMWVSS